jgi:hypothetical protein
VRRDLGGALRALVLPTLALLAVIAFAPGRLTLVVRIYALVVCAMALGLALAALRRSYPQAQRLRPQVGQRAKSPPPPSLARIENEVALGVAGAFDLHYRLVPRIRSLAAGLLVSRRRVSFDAEPESARRLLGPETWELVREDRQSPKDRLARGLPAPDLHRVVESLEGI